MQSSDRGQGTSYQQPEQWHQGRSPAAGAGTRIGPRPVPKSTSALRHVQPRPSRATLSADALTDGADSRSDSSAVAQQVAVVKRRQAESAEAQGDWDDSDWTEGEDQGRYPSERTRGKQKQKYLVGLSDSSGDEEEWHVRRRDLRLDDDDADHEGYHDGDGYGDDDHERDRNGDHLAEQDEHDAHGEQGQLDEARRRRDARYTNPEPGGPSNDGPRLAPWHPRSAIAQRYVAASNQVLESEESSPPLLGVGQNEVRTPLGTPEAAEPTVEPRERLEWQTMLSSVLGSEVLRSETNRITSVDAPVLTREENMYRRWLDIRAALRGRGHVKGAVDAEEKRLLDGWGVMVRQIIEAVKAFRPPTLDNYFESQPPESPNRELSRRSSVSSSGGNMWGSAGAQADKERVLEEVGELLARVDSAEDQFPSSRKLRDIVPEWGSTEIQGKLAALYSWYNVTSSLRLQIRILQKWTGSDTLEIARHRTGAGDTAQGTEMEESTFVERILKEDSLQSTFEKRTLSTLNHLIAKAKRTILVHHRAFAAMDLPSFEPELVQLVNFPTRLMEGALKLRLDYAGKLKEPSVLIVDSLTDDLRAALALACRIKLQYTETMVPIPEDGWDLPPCIDDGYDAVLRDALRFFFRLLNFKLKGSVYFKETEILEPEWRFLSTAVEVIEGGDLIVAEQITKIVNKLFARIVTYFERELQAPSTTRGIKKGGTAAGNEAGTNPAAPGGARGPSTAGGLTRGKVHMSMDDKAKWIYAVFDNVRIRSRKLLGFARDIRGRLDNAAEYDLENADLGAFLQRLISAEYFLVYTEAFEEEGVYLIAEPALHDKPELIQELLCKCLRRVRPSEEETAMAAEANANALAGEILGEPTAAERDDKDEIDGGSLHAGDAGTDEEPHYLLLLSPRDPFMWTGRVMKHSMPRVDIDLKERRVRLIADGPKGRLHVCKEHFYSVFAGADGGEGSPTPRTNGAGAGAAAGAGAVGAVPAFPLEIISEHMAHMSAVQRELKLINKGVYMLSDTIIRAVPKIRRAMRPRVANSGTARNSTDTVRGPGAGHGDWDELIQNCFSMAAEQGFRSLPFIESARLRDQMTLALARLAIDWVAFICDDCVTTDRKTFKWAVAALENAMHITRAENIFHLSEADFGLMRSKVASCMALLISHFDIMGARSSVAEAQKEQERLERERAERSAAALDPAGASVAAAAAAAAAASQAQHEGSTDNERTAELRALAARMVAGSGGGAPPMLGRADSGMRATEERWVQKVMEWDAARAAIEAEQRLIGRVLDDTRLEDRGLQFLASSSSRIQIRWQQGRFIGGGTFGTVYLAVNLDSGGLMAVKEIRFQDISSTPSLYKQIKDEMDVMEMLSHPNIVEYYGIEVHRDKVYIFEEYCQGGSLAHLLEHGRIEDEAVIQVYTLQMLDGLVYLHSKGVVHRDIKPDSESFGVVSRPDFSIGTESSTPFSVTDILLDHMGVIKFVDFGAAKILAKNSRTVQRSRRPGVVAPNAMAGMIGPDGRPTGAAAVQSLQGTPMYMSPEVIKGESRGRRGAMDVWSLGCVVLEFATGRRPWSQLDNEWCVARCIALHARKSSLPADIGADDKSSSDALQRTGRSCSISAWHSSTLLCPNQVNSANSAPTLFVNVSSSIPTRGPPPRKCGSTHGFRASLMN